MSENYDDDSVWETYVPTFSEMYSKDTVYRLRSQAECEPWTIMPHGTTCWNNNPEKCIYRRRKAKPEPADDGPKYETVVTSLEVTMQDKVLYKVWLDGDLVGVSVDGDDESIMISPSSWPALRAAIDRLIGECRE